MLLWGKVFVQVPMVNLMTVLRFNLHPGTLWDYRHNKTGNKWIKAFSVKDQIFARNKFQEKEIRKRQPVQAISASFSSHARRVIILRFCQQCDPAER